MSQGTVLLLNEALNTLEAGSQPVHGVFSDGDDSQTRPAYVAAPASHYAPGLLDHLLDLSIRAGKLKRPDLLAQVEGLRNDYQRAMSQLTEIEEYAAALDRDISAARPTQTATQINAKKNPQDPFR